MTLSEIAQKALDELPESEKLRFKAAADAAEQWAVAKDTEIRERDMYCFRAGFLAALKAVADLPLITGY